MNPLPLFLIIVTLPLLLGSECNAELRTWTAVNGNEIEAEFVSNEKGIVKLKLKSGKVFEVPANKLSKEDNKFISSLAKPEGVNVEELEFREDIAYLKGSDTPYTGKVFVLYENGKKWIESNYKDGKEEGLHVAWYENGQKKAEGNVKDGKPDGLWVRWHKNGQKFAEGNYKNGKGSGRQISWYENGKKKGEVNMKDGKQDGLGVAWHENGQMKGEVNWKDGKAVEGSRKYWNSKGEPVDSKEEALK